MKRPWKIEYAKPEGGVAIAGSFHTKVGAQIARLRIQGENPGVVYEIRKRVEFDAKS